MSHTLLDEPFSVRDESYTQIHDESYSVLDESFSVRDEPLSVRDESYTHKYMMSHVHTPGESLMSHALMCACRS